MEDVERGDTFERKLEALINGCSMEGGSDTPDFVLARYLRGCLRAFNAAVGARETWYGRVRENVPPPCCGFACECWRGTEDATAEDMGVQPCVDCGHLPSEHARGEIPIKATLGLLDKEVEDHG